MRRSRGIVVNKRAFDLREAIKEARFLPEPTYRFKVGDSVEIGNLINVKVIEVFEDGKVYEIQYDSSSNIRGETVTDRNLTMIVNWLRIRPVAPKEDHRIIKNDDLRISFVNTPIETLLGKLYKSLRISIFM